jgi:hypothetical protein
MAQVMVTTDSSPKWFTEVDLDGYERAKEATLHFLPQLEYSDAPFTRVQFDEVDPAATPSSTPGAE